MAKLNTVTETAGITEVALVRLSSLPMLTFLRQEPVTVLATLRPLELAEEAQLKVTGTRSRGLTVEKAELTLVTPEVIDDDGATGYVVRDVRGRRYLIGSRDMAAPVLTYVRSTGVLGDGRSGYEYKVEFSAPRAATEAVV